MLQPPTLSFATTNASPSQLDSPAYLIPVLISTPQALRKSHSADPLVSYGLNCTSAPSAQYQVFGSNSVSASSYDPSKCQWVGQHCGESATYERDGYQPSSLVDSDAERHEPSSPTLACYRRAPFKGQGSQRPVIRSGELPLSPPSQTPSHFLNRGVTAPCNSSPHENRPPLLSVTPLQSLRQAVGPPTLDSGRTHSGSLGAHASSPASRMVINTHLGHVRFSTRYLKIFLTTLEWTVSYSFVETGRYSCCCWNRWMWQVNCNSERVSRLQSFDTQLPWIISQSTSL